MIWQIVTALATVLALLVSVLIAGFSVARESHIRFIDNFDKLYTKTFSLRRRLTTIVQKLDGEEFFYETDRIWHCEMLCDEVLDYLTEMENFFFLVIGHRSVYRSFEKLMSLALYQRLSVFYGFILRQRRETNNPKLFSNYEAALKRIGNMKKIKKQLPAYQKNVILASALLTVVRAGRKSPIPGREKTANPGRTRIANFGREKIASPRIGRKFRA